MQEQEMKFYKNMLIEKKHFLEQRLEKISHSKIRENPISADIDDQSQELENNEVIDALDGLENIELEKVEQALDRLEHGSYGVCLECGSEISSARLKALPYARKCMDCAY